jgi:hypothetical protein
MLNSVIHGRLLDIIVILFLGPTISFAWLFGAIAGIAFFFLRRALKIASTGPGHSGGAD